MYAIVKSGGKQYRVERGQSLLVDRLPVEEGNTCSLESLLVVDGDKLVDSGARVEARVVAHERGPKLRVVKFKPKRGYKRRTGHRQELTRLEITAIEAGGPARGARSKREAGPSGQRPRSGARQRSGAATGERSGSAAGKRSTSAPRKRATAKKEDSDGS
jgi:large subunit ribosomal protein L21